MLPGAYKAWAKKFRKNYNPSSHHFLLLSRRSKILKYLYLVVSRHKKLTCSVLAFCACNLCDELEKKKGSAGMLILVPETKKRGNTF
jgi:hypothetical protein